MKLSFLERHGWAEVAIRIILNKFPKIKKIAKKVRGGASHGSKSAAQEPNQTQQVIDPAWKAEYFERVAASIADESIVLIHSSMDGLESIGITVEDFMVFMHDQVDKRNITFVLPCFPITNLKKPTPKSRPYDPGKTLCWTGMLPNAFIGDPDVIRTRFPYNSLAALGPKAQEMMANDLDAERVYDNNSAWRYCLDNHAKILFCGVKASGSNTIAIHMTCDVMADEWPVADWYEDVTYKIKLDGQVTEKTIKVQKDFWYQYCMEERTSGRLKEKGALTEDSIHGCNLGLVDDCRVMMYVLIDLCRQGKLMYRVPKRYWKKQ